MEDNIKRNSIWVNTFTEESVKKFIDDIEDVINGGARIVPIYINSYGGDVYSCLAMIDYINHLRKTIVFPTIAIGKAMSCGLFLMSFGSMGFRFASENSSLLLHDVSTFVQGKYTDAILDLKETEKLRDSVFVGLAKHCKHKDSKHFIKLLAKHNFADIHLTPTEALQHKLIDHISIPKITKTITFNVEK